MIQAYLDSIQEKGAEIVKQYTDGLMDALLTGKSNVSELRKESARVVYLWRVLKNVYLSGTTPYMGGAAVTDTYIQSVNGKLWHYNGRFDAIDLSEDQYDAITPDDGDGGSVAPTPAPADDHYRSGSVAVTAGTNIITFVKDGVPTPLPSADYTVVMWVTLTDGSIQRNLVPSTKTAGGFVVTDVLASGTLEYQATLNT